MEFCETKIPGVFEIRSQSHSDQRGHFTRTFCAQEFAAQGLELPVAQMAISHNIKRATLRGLHYIPAEYGEAKLVRCIRGRIFDVAVDLRPQANTFGHWIGLELSVSNQNALYIPKGVAHGFITLADDTDVAYQFSEAHRPGLDEGVLWNDPDLAIEWPIAPQVLSDRDIALPSLRQTGLMG